MNVCVSYALVEGVFKRRQQLNTIRRRCFFTDGDALSWKALIVLRNELFFSKMELRFLRVDLITYLALLMHICWGW